jgi:hypothetical protein
VPRRSTNVLGLLAIAALCVFLGGQGALAVGAGVAAGLLLPTVGYIVVQQRRNRRRAVAGVWAGYCGLTAHSLAPLPAVLHGVTIKRSDRLGRPANAGGVAPGHLTVSGEGIRWQANRWARLGGVSGGASLAWSSVEATDVGPVPGTRWRLNSLLTLRLADGIAVSGIVFGNGLGLRAILDLVAAGDRNNRNS